MEFCDSLNLDAILEPVKSMSGRDELERRQGRRASHCPSDRRRHRCACRTRPAVKAGAVLLPARQHLRLHARGAGFPRLLAALPQGRRPHRAACRATASPRTTSSAPRFASASRCSPTRTSAVCKLFDVIKRKDMYGRKVTRDRAQHLPDRCARACCAASGARSRWPVTRRKYSEAVTSAVKAANTRRRACSCSTPTC